jgi:hypothetical protein
MSTPDSAFSQLVGEAKMSKQDESFPPFVRPRVFGWLWVVLIALLVGLAIVFLRYTSAG